MTPDHPLDTLARALSGSGSAAAGLVAFRHLLDAMPVMIGLVDERRRHVFANHAYLEFAGRSMKELDGLPMAEVLGEDFHRAAQSAIERVMRGETVQTEGWMPNPRGGQCYMLRVLAPHRAEDGSVAGCFTLLQDMTERRQSQDDLFRLAYYDPVTALANRALMLKHMGDFRAMGEQFTLIVVEVDRYPDIRSSLGQAFADELLADLAERLTRDGGPVDLLARVSDHGFGLLISGPCDMPVIERRLETVSAIVRQARSSTGAAVFLSASIGVKATGEMPERAEDVLRDAEIAASRAREGGGGRRAWFEPAMHARVVEQVSLEHDLRGALERESGLWLAYQPIVELVTGGLAGFEALARWNHPARGNLPPGVFIPIAESTGLVVSLGRWVLREACRQIADWQEKRVPGSAPLFMSVNLSPRQLVDPGFVKTVRAILRETGCEPQWLKLEITESAVMDKAEQAIAILQELRSLGIKMSIDDFGTGYSSLSYLHRLPIDSLKVDRSFVSAMHQSEENRAIVRIIVDLARILGFDVIAEGIETMADANLLRALAVDYGQGYHFARPLPVGDAEKLVTDEPPWRERG